MTNKHCLVYETLGKVSDLVVESNNNEQMRLTGVFGVCGVKNQNNRVYDKDNYAQMVESLQHVIETEGCPGELEHPNSMNINLENVSHKIESIQMNEDGTITGTILLLNTPKGKIAQAIVEGGLPLYISSRGAGTITNEGRVTLSTIKTYDLVGTPGFSQAKLTLKQNQTLECLNEGLEDENQIWAIVEGDDSEDLLGDDSEDKKEDKKEDNKEDKKEKTSEKKENSDATETSDDDDKDDKENNKNNDNEDIDMKDLKDAIDKLSDQVASLEAELHVAQESLNETKSSIPTVNYDAIEKWVKEEFGNEFKSSIMEAVKEENDAVITTKISEAIENIAEGVQNWVTEEFAPEVQNWVTEEFAPEVQNWVTEEFAPEVQNWVTEEFAPEVQNWITEEFAPEVQNWVTEEFAPVVESWITEEFAPIQSEKIESKVNENVNAFIESQKAGRLDEIDALLESVDNKEEIEKLVKENATDAKYAGVYVVENMPAEYRPSWELLNEDRKNEIVRQSRMFDFTKDGVLENFWANVDFTKETPKFVTETSNDVVGNYHNNIVKQMMYLRNNVNLS